MTDSPKVTAAIDQAAAATRDYFDVLDLNLADPETLRVVRATTYAIANLPSGSFEGWIRALNQMDAQ